MGRVRTNTIKKAARKLIEKNYSSLAQSFEENKAFLTANKQKIIIPSKHIRNCVAGYITHLMKRCEKGPVRGISLKVQEEERERKDNYVPITSEFASGKIQMNSVTQAMIKSLGFESVLAKPKRDTTEETH